MSEKPYDPEDLKAALSNVLDEIQLDDMGPPEILDMPPGRSTYNVYCTDRQWQLISYALRFTLGSMEGAVEDQEFSGGMCEDDDDDPETICDECKAYWADCMCNCTEPWCIKCGLLRDECECLSVPPSVPTEASTPIPQPPAAGWDEF